jgi:peptidylprolyl isomerase
MAPKQGDTVKVHYRGTLADGTEFDSSEGSDPLEFTVGAGEVIPGFDSAVQDMSDVGDKKTVTIPSEEAYGDRVEEAKQQVPLEAFPERPQVGWVVELTTPEGQNVQAVVAEVGETTATIDFNHPLAGEDLTFEIELVHITSTD